jgi:MFS family permease
VPDQIPDRQRGTVSAFVGLAIPLGSILGSIIVGQVLKFPQASYLFLILVLLTVLLPFGLFQRDKPLPKEHLSRFHLRSFLMGFWVSPHSFPDFGWAWLTRFLAIFAYALGTGYIFYYLQDYVKLPAHDVLQSASALSILIAFLVIVFTIISGILSDRFQRRKIFVLLSGFIIAVSLLLFGLFPDWTMALIAAAILGVGFGIYIAVDGALVTQVLPSANSRGKDLGVINIANTLPQSLAPAVAAFIVHVSQSYLLLFVLAAVFALLSGFLIRPIKGVR